MNYKESIKITVATPVYNRADCIGRCIESVSGQTLLPFEHLIVDDGSTDNTKEVIKKYILNHPHISLFEAPKNGGENYARNKLVEYAKGDFILFLDSDDYLLPNAINDVVENILKNPEYFHYLFVPSDREEEFNKSIRFKEQTAVVRFEDWIAEDVDGDFIHVIHKSGFEGNKFFEEIRGFPGINFMRIYRKNKVQLYVNKIVAVRDRFRSDALSLIGYLDNKRSMEENYFNTDMFFKYFLEDFKRLKPQLFSKRIVKQILIGIAVGKYQRNKELFSFIDDKIKKYILQILNFFHFSYPVYLLIKYKSLSKRKQ